MRTKPDIWIYLVDETWLWERSGIPLPTSTRMIGVYVVDSSHVYICSMNPNVEAYFVETVCLGVPNTDPGYEELLDTVQEGDAYTEPVKYFSASDFEGASVIDPRNDLLPAEGNARFPYPHEWDLEELAENHPDKTLIAAALDEAWEDARSNAYF